MSELINALPRVQIGQYTFFVADEHPVALLRSAGQPDQFLKWPQLFTGIHSPLVHLYPAANALWICYQTENEAGDERYPALSAPQQLAAVRLGLDASIEFFQATDVKILGVTDHGLWTGTSLFQEIDDEYHGGPVPVTYTNPETLTVRSPGLPERQIEFDRHVDSIRQREGKIELWVNPSAPISHPDGEGGASYEYRCSSLLLPDFDSLPARLRFRDLVPEGWGQPVDPEQMEKLSDEFLNNSEQNSETIDLSGVSGAMWELASLSTAQQEQAVSAIVDEFKHLEQYWHGGPTGISALVDGLAQARVDVFDVWPRTRIEVSFTHPYYSSGRMRRTLYPFDTAGRIQYNPYASIHLMEDLDTLDLPDPALARDGILDI